jgi:CRP-like cAMP-binding protein
MFAQLFAVQTSELEKFSKHCVLVRRRAHAPLMIEGTPADAFVVVIHGAVRVTQQTHFVLCCGPGFYTGDASLSKNVPSATTVVTASECLLLVVPKPSWEKYVKRNALLPDAFLEKAVATTALAKSWRQLKVFGAMSDAQLGFMGSVARVVKLQAGQKLILCRRRIDGCYIVMEGQVSVSLEDMHISAQSGRVIGLQNLLGTSYADAVVGEDDSACSMIIEAARPSVLLRITRSDAVSLIGGFDAPLNIVGNFEASAALLAALGNDVQMKSGKHSSPEDGVLYDVAAASILARSARLSALMETMIQLEQSTPQALLSCAAECDFFTQRAAAHSPTGAPIVSPPSLLLDFGRDLYQRYFAPDAPCTTVRDFVPEELRLLVGTFIATPETPSGSGLTLSQTGTGSAVVPVTLFSDIIGAINLELTRMLCDLKESMALRQIIESIIKGQDNSAEACSFLDADSHSSAIESLSKKGMIARFITSKLNRCESEHSIHRSST